MNAFMRARRGGTVRVLRRASTVAAAATLTISVAACASAQGTIERRVSTIKDGTVRMMYRAKAGVCGSGQNMSFNWSDRGSSRNGKRASEWESECEPGPVRVAIDVAQGQVIALRYYVGGRWRSTPPDVIDLGTVGSADAAKYFMAVASSDDGKVGREAIVPAIIADSAEVWPQLLKLAKDDRRPRSTRTQAVFWLGQAASDATGALEDLTADEKEDMDVREQAIFALSQRPKDEGVPALLKIAKGTGSPRLRKRAIFWLGQSGDPRALSYFEEVLARK
jgi:hypothetical protein